MIFYGGSISLFERFLSAYLDKKNNFVHNLGKTHEEIGFITAGEYLDERLRETVLNV